MNIKQQVSTLMQKEMDRKAFLKHAGIAALALVGLPAIVNALSTATNGPAPTRSGYGTGYSGSVYGGTKRS